MYILGHYSVLVRTSYTVLKAIYILETMDPIKTSICRDTMSSTLRTILKILGPSTTFTAGCWDLWVSVRVLEVPPWLRLPWPSSYSRWQLLVDIPPRSPSPVTDITCIMYGGGKS